MQYLKVEWIHENDQYPVVLYSELDDDRMEVRKVEKFRDGRVGFASHQQTSGTTQLGIEPLPSIEEIASDPQFVPAEITQQEFESVWTQTTESE